MAVTNAVSWRSEGIRYKKNEVFLDVVESVNLLVNSNGSVVRSEVMGALKMRTFLSGMPECKLGLNDKVGAPCQLPQYTLSCQLQVSVVDAGGSQKDMSRLDLAFYSPCMPLPVFSQ